MPLQRWQIKFGLHKPLDYVNPHGTSKVGSKNIRVLAHVGLSALNSPQARLGGRILFVCFLVEGAYKQQGREVFFGRGFHYRPSSKQRSAPPQKPQACLSPRPRLGLGLVSVPRTTGLLAASTSTPTKRGV